MTTEIMRRNPLLPLLGLSITLPFLLCSIQKVVLGIISVKNISTHSLRLNGVSHMVKTTHIVREEIYCCHHMDHSFRFLARVLLYAPSHRLDYIPLPLIHQSWSTGWNEK